MAAKGLPQLGKTVVEDLKRLAKLEAELAGQQVRSAMKKRAVAAALGGGGLLFLFYGSIFLLAAAAAGLALVVAWWLALLIMGGGLVVLAVLMVGLAARGMAKAGGPVPDETRQSVKEDVRSLRGQTS